MIIKNLRKVKSDASFFLITNFILDHRSLPTFNGVCCRSIGVQCNPSTVDQSTKTSVITDDELISDRTIRILTPSSTDHIKRSNSQEFLLNGIENNREQKIILTSTCLDDDQMVRISSCLSR